MRRSDNLDRTQGDLAIEFGEKVTGRLGVSFFDDEVSDGYIGIDFGVRTKMAGQFSSFVGAGVFAGSWAITESAEDDGIDNDDDSCIDEKGEKKTVVVDNLYALFPEAGFHVWLSDSVRLTGSYRYYMMSHGRDRDMAMYGVGLGFALK